MRIGTYPDIQIHLNKIVLLSVLALLLFLTANGQNETTNWYFGDKAGISFVNGAPVSNTQGQLKSGEGCATISDKFGNLLFYSDGIFVWNKTHKLMPNGSGLHGHSSSTQSAYIVQKPSITSIYYIFTLDCEAGNNGVCYSVVNMNLDHGNGDIADKNVLIRNKCTERIAVYKHDKKNGIWIVIHDFNSNAFVAYLLTKKGLSANPVISSVGLKHEISKYNNMGYMKFSPDGKRLAVAVNGMDCVQLFDFDTKTGVLTNPTTIQFLKNSKPYGVEFSPSGKILYVGMVNGGKIYQANLRLKNEIAITKTLCLIGQSKTGQSMGALQLGTDQRIYVSENLSNYLAAIEQPDSLGLLCKFNAREVFLKNKTCTQGLPIFYLYNKQNIYSIQSFDSSTKIQLNQKYILNNVLFDTDKATLDSESKLVLSVLSDYMKSHYKVRIKIIGHTDNKGGAEHNNKLSLIRAAEVRNFLVSRKIEIGRISVAGKGFYNPIDENDTETGRHRNRRIEFILKN